MKKYGFAILLAFVLNILPVKPQTTLPPYEFSVAPGTTLANCIPVPNQTTWCWTGDGNVYKSVNGAAFVSAISIAAAGIQSITVCNAAGTNCGSANTGPGIQLNLATKATTTSVTTSTTVVQ